jgi:hypothetical protein
MKLKALVAALALIGAGVANAGYIATTDTSDTAPVLLTVMNTTNTTSAVFDLGMNRTSFTSNFGQIAGTDSLVITWNLAGNSVSAAYGSGAAFDLSAYGQTATTTNSWSTAAATMGTMAATSVYDVIAFDRDSTAFAAQHALTTASAAPSVTNTNLLNMGYATNNALFINGNSTSGADNGANVATSGTQYQFTSFKGTWGGYMGNATAALGSNLNFYAMDGNGTSSVAKETTTLLGGVWNLSADNSTLTYTISNVAAVPEPSSIAMLLAGLGMLGMIARRRIA